MKERTHNCGEIKKENINEEVVLTGWAQRIRDHGGKKFIDLRDRKGMTQVVFDPEITSEFEKVEELSREYLINIEGKVRSRPEGTINPKMTTGEIEIIVTSFTVMSECKPLPFEIDEDHFKNVNEDLRLKHRYLDLRRHEMHETLVARTKFYKGMRDFLVDKDFVEVETPTLTKSTPEGARDWLVPARKQQGKFYALPQSPQLFKQLLMVAGVERYFQIAKCYRDEDSRKDRQPEFTQLDLEASFLSQEELLEMMEEMFQYVFRYAFNREVEIPFKKMEYDEVVERFGTDKPDLRIKGMELKNISDIVENSGFSVFANVVKNGGLVKGLNVKNGSNTFSRKGIDSLIEFVQGEGGNGLAWMKITKDGTESSITKFFTNEELNNIKERLEAEEGDLLLFVADKYHKTNELLDSLRRHLAEKLELIDESGLEFLWVYNYPMFAWDEDNGTIEAEHNPFTMCNEKDLPIIESIKDQQDAIKKKDELLKIKTDCYDLVLNGIEIGSGARRIHLPHIQSKVFQIIGLSQKEVEEKFGWFVEAYDYGAPPHRGFAPGLDRILMLMMNKSSIREVIAFPKNKNGYCPMTGSPSKVDEEQLKELGIQLKGNKQDKANVKFPEKNY